MRPSYGSGNCYGLLEKQGFLSFERLIRGLKHGQQRRRQTHWQQTERYPDPHVNISTIERLATGFRFTEGPV